MDGGGKVREKENSRVRESEGGRGWVRERRENEGERGINRGEGE